LRIGAIYPSFYTRIPQLAGTPAQEKIPEAAKQGSVPREINPNKPPVEVTISPAGWEAYNRYKTDTAQNPAVQTEAAQKNGLPDLPQSPRGEAAQGGGKASGAKEIGDVFEPHECQTCKSRKYQDSSSDPSVSYQSPTHIGPNQAGAAVASHESEHVAHEQAKAEREGRKIVSQTVSLSTSICPECGRIYISGGVTRTVTADKRDNTPEVPEKTV
jgi:hypothetical protein